MADRMALLGELEKLELQLLHGDQHDRSTANIIGRAIHFLRAPPPEAGVREALQKARDFIAYELPLTGKFIIPDLDAALTLSSPPPTAGREEIPQYGALHHCRLRLLLWLWPAIFPFTGNAGWRCRN